MLPGRLVHSRMLLRKKVPSCVRFASTTEGGQNHYENLHLMPGADLMEIKRSFKQISKKMHPDVLQSQELTENDKEKKKDRYLNIKKSYELLMDPQKKKDYDRKLGFGNAARRAFNQRTSTGFHYRTSQNFGRTASTNNDASHFDSKSHYERNLRNEKEMNARKIIMFGDLFRHNISTRDIGGGIHRDIYGRYSRAEDARKERQFMLYLVGGFVSVMTIWELALGRPRPHPRTKDTQEQPAVKAPVQLTSRDSALAAPATVADSTSGADSPEVKNAPAVNNSYSSMMVSHAVHGG